MGLLALALKIIQVDPHHFFPFRVIVYCENILWLFIIQLRKFYILLYFLF
jgi:hypothetical protein